MSIGTPILLSVCYDWRAEIYSIIQGKASAISIRNKLYAIIYILVLILIVGVVLTSLSTPPANFTQPVTLPMSLDYPSFSELGLVIGNTNYTMHIDITLFANHSIAENTPVALYVDGSIGTGLIDNISTFTLFGATIAQIKVGFEGAYEVHYNKIFLPYGPPQGGTLLIVNRTTPCAVSEINYGNTTLCGIQPTIITWRVQGNYNPVITIFYKNGTTISQAYTDYKVAVIASEVIQAENLSVQSTRIEIGLAVPVVMFSFVEAVRHISSFLKPRPSRPTQGTTN